MFLFNKRKINLRIKVKQKEDVIGFLGCFLEKIQELREKYPYVIISIEVS